MVQVGRLAIDCSQFSDSFVELCRSIERIFLIKGCTAVLFEESSIFGQSRLDLIIEKKLRKNAKFLSQKLITEIDGGVHNACAQRFVSSTVLTWTLFILIYTGICLAYFDLKKCILKPKLSFFSLLIFFVCAVCRNSNFVFVLPMKT